MASGPMAPEAIDGTGDHSGVVILYIAAQPPLSGHTPKVASLRYPAQAGGAASREATVNAYIEALNTSDTPALRLLSAGSGPRWGPGLTDH